MVSRREGVEYNGRNIVVACSEDIFLPLIGGTKKLR
jgi:hypothetical protein